MSNSSLFAAFERMWQNMLSKLNDYSNEIDGVISQNAADIATIKEDLDAFFADADMTGSAKDTLKELQAYIASDETGAAAMLASIVENADHINSVEALLAELEEGLEGANSAIAANTASAASKVKQSDYDAKMSELDTKDASLEERMANVEVLLGDGDGSVAKQVATAKSEVLETASQDATTKANAAETNAKSHATNLNASLVNRIAEAEERLSSELNAERSRINSFVALAEGSTTGDAELQDARVGFDGSVYESAGDAIRTQIQDLNVALEQKGEFSMDELEVSAETAEQATILYFSDGEIEKSVRIPMPVDEALSVDSNNPIRNSVVAQEFSIINEEIKALKEDGIGGGDLGAVMRLTNQNGTSSLTTSYGSAANLMFTFVSTDDDVPTGNGVCTITVNGINKLSTNIPQGLNSIDVSSFLEIGTNNITVTVADIYGKIRMLNYTVTVIKLIIESQFNSTTPYTGDITFKYTAYGAIEKTIHFVIDGTEVGTVVTSLSGKQATRTISKMSHGAHTLEVYSTADVGENTLYSPKLSYDIICLEDGVEDPIIASAYSAEDVSQGELIDIPYIVYDPTRLSCDITLSVYTMDSGNEVTYSTHDITVDRSQQHWTLRKYPVGDVYFRIQYGDLSKTHHVVVEESRVKIEAETNDMELHLTSEGRTNNEIHPDVWSYGDIETTFENVNWATTGWVQDENGDSCLRLNGTATAEIQFQPFKDDLRVYGKTLELEFTIRDVNNRDATVISCMSGGIGFEVRPDKAYIRSEGNEVYCNYKDEERVRLSFVVEASSEHRLLMIYLNGVLSDAVQYTTTDNFQQSTPVNITIGSPNCGVDVYNIRSYSTALPSPSIVTNFLADMADVGRKTAVYEDNDIYDEFGAISFAKAREKNSCMIIIGTLPQSKGDKKNGKVVYYDVEDSNLNFEDTMQIDVQGTSSQWSKQATVLSNQCAKISI